MVNVGQNKDKGARFARIPTGIETRTFCLMLVCRGAVYHTRKSAGEFKHFHWGCDCKVVPSFEDDPDAKVVEDVRPKELHEQWKACKRVDDEISAPSLTKAAVKRQLIINPAASLNAPPEVAVPLLRAINMYYVPDDTERCGYYECKECGSRFLDIKIAPSLVCPYCGEEPDMEIGPDDEMPVIKEDAKLIKMLSNKEEVEKYDKLLSLAVTGGDFDWI